VNTELKHLVQLVKRSTQPVKSVVERYMEETIWSVLKDEYRRMSEVQKEQLYQRLEQERK
jgi:hypothetical protein